MNGRTLSDLGAGENAVIAGVAGETGLARRLLEMGLVAGERVRVIGFAPFGDPMEIEVQGYRLSLRKREAAGIALGTA